MNAKSCLTAYETAILTLYLVNEFEREKSKTSTRVRVSQHTLRRISNRTRLRPAFLDEWSDALGTLGWSTFVVGDHFNLIRTDTTQNWARIGGKRIIDTLISIHRGEGGVLDNIRDKIEADYAREERIEDEEY